MQILCNAINVHISSEYQLLFSPCLLDSRRKIQNVPESENNSHPPSFLDDQAVMAARCWRESDYFSSCILNTRPDLYFWYIDALVAQTRKARTTTITRSNTSNSPLTQLNSRLKMVLDVTTGDMVGKTLSFNTCADLNFYCSVQRGSVMGLLWEKTHWWID